jgi:RNA polymerase sigma-70 factor (ECF subfamily)
MPPLPSWYTGRDEIASFLRLYPLAESHSWRMLQTSANGQPALAGYLFDEDAEAFVPNCLSVLTLREDRIEEITAFLTPDLFSHFDLPASIAA